MKLALLSLLPALALAAPPPAKRATVLLIPLDTGAEAAAPKLETWMLDAMAPFPGLALQKPDDLFGVPPDDAAEASLQRAEKGYAESRAAFEKKDFADAERKLRATLKEFGKSAGALRECGHYCDALVMYAAVLQKRGDLEEAKLALLDLLALSPTWEIDPKRLGHEVIALRAQVATGHSGSLRGSANVTSRPAGARVYLDGEFKGYAPVSLQTLPVGKHLLRVERAGFKRHGQIIEVGPDEIEVVADLTPTPAWDSWDAQMDRVAADASRGGGASLQKLSKSLGLEHAVVGTVKAMGDGATEVAVGLFDLRAGRRVSHRKVVYQGDEYGQLQSEVGRLVNTLLTSTGSAKKISSGSDPLDGHSGTEEWNREDRGGRTSAKSKKSNGDPLDGVSGMEDW